MVRRPSLRAGHARAERGASAVEFALIAMPILVLLFGMVQYGLYFWAMQGGSDIARSAARSASVGDPADCAAFREAIRGEVNDLTGSGATAQITRTYVRQKAGEVTIGDRVEVRVRFKSIDMHFPFIPFINDGMVTAEAESRVDYVPSQPETCS